MENLRTPEDVKKEVQEIIALSSFCKMEARQRKFDLYESLIGVFARECKDKRIQGMATEAFNARYSEVWNKDKKGDV